MFKKLGIQGWGKLQPTIISALLCNKAVLLWGKHGTCKTLASEVITKSLIGGEFKTYNCPNTGTDELMGYINVKKLKEEKVEFIPSKTSIWGANGVLFDEINRANPLMQSKFMEIILNAKLNGEHTETQFRFAACNPPKEYATTLMDKAMLSRFVTLKVPDNIPIESLLNADIKVVDFSSKFQEMKDSKISDKDKLYIKDVVVLLVNKIKENNYFSSRQIIDLNNLLISYMKYCKVMKKMPDSKDIIVIAHSLLPEGELTGENVDYNFLKNIIAALDALKIINVSMLDFSDVNVINFLTKISDERWEEIKSDISSDFVEIIHYRRYNVNIKLEDIIEGVVV